MSSPFKEHIRKAMDNPGLQIALDHNADRRKDARQNAYSSLPEDISIFRGRAHEMRAEVIANLEGYLGQLIRKAEANGMIVHQAADAAEAVQIVLGIAQQKNARLIAKAKSMLSEEIGLNHVLENAGIRAVETDLGEYIVQLRGEAPAHIITPAVHLRAIDVGQTFHDKLGLPLTEDVPTMTSAARKELRQVFMDADIGISGVNFAVAETGTLCLVTNEGNGRMVVTLPPVHIALMGIERLVPTLDDLALMLYLLPRSATGQKLSVYVSLINGPARDEPAGESPQERHLVLIDNGRRAVRQSSLAEALYCIRCGSCLNICPVFRELGGHAYVSTHGKGSIYPGPIGSVLSPALFGQSEFGHLARASSLCGSCKEACPVDIDLPKLLLRVRAGLTTQPLSESTKPSYAPNAPGYLSLGMRVFTFFAVSSWRFTAAQRAAGFFSRILAPFSPWLHLPALTGWGYSKDFPRPAARPYREIWKTRKSQEPALNLPQNGKAIPHSAPKPNFRATATREALVNRFSEELSALGGKVIRCQSSELSVLIIQLLRERGISRIQAWKDEQLPGDLPAKLRSAGIEIHHHHDPATTAGLTGAQGGIAETGTLVMAGGPNVPLTASLVPEIHLAVLRASTIYERLPEALNSSDIRSSTSSTLISGPSRTADIEMTLTVGMHGPREVHVFCLTDC